MQSIESSYCSSEQAMTCSQQAPTWHANNVYVRSFIPCFRRSENLSDCSMLRNSTITYHTHTLILLETSALYKLFTYLPTYLLTYLLTHARTDNCVIIIVIFIFSQTSLDMIHFWSQQQSAWCPWPLTFWPWNWSALLFVAWATYVATYHYYWLAYFLLFPWTEIGK